MAKIKITERFKIFIVNGEEQVLCEDCFPDNDEGICDLGNVTAIHKDGLIKLIGYGVFEAPESVTDMDALYRCIHKILNSIHRCTDDQVTEVPLDRWDIDKKYLYNDSDRYYKLA